MTITSSLSRNRIRLSSRSGQFPAGPGVKPMGTWHRPYGPMEPEDHQLPHGKRSVLDAVENRRGQVLGISEELFRNPELSGAENRACRFLAGLLKEEGFQVRVGMAGLPTAFVAVRQGRGRGPRIALLAEYDALPDIGHGCGHNLIAAAAVGAALGTVPLLGSLPGELRVIGTPAEETIGGKAVLAESGCFRDLDAAMMFHPGGENRVFTDSLAANTLQVEFGGRVAHAVVHPDRGINALDALVDLYGSTRRMAREVDEKSCLPGVILEGGKRPNMIPDRAVGVFTLRATNLERLERLRRRFHSEVEGICRRTGCRYHIRPLDRIYREMRTNRPLAETFKENLRFFHVTTRDKSRTRMGSLDMGNVSQVVPSIHPFIAICPSGLASHTAEFARATVSTRGREGLFLATRVLALTAADFLMDPDLRRRVRQEFEESAATGNR